MELIYDDNDCLEEVFKGIFCLIKEGKFDMWYKINWWWLGCINKDGSLDMCFEVNKIFFNYFF